LHDYKTTEANGKVQDKYSTPISTGIITDDKKKKRINAHQAKNSLIYRGSV
jgi:6,7-dimethyl-8-ribityllumazine synthase